MARRASARLAARLQSSAGRIPASTGSCSTGVGCKHPVIIRRVQFRLTSNKLVCLLLLYVWHSIQPVHTHVLGQRCEVLMDLLPIP